MSQMLYPLSPRDVHLCMLWATTLAHVATTLLQVEQARDNYNDREATRLKKLARLAGIKDSADDSKPKPK